MTGPPPASIAGLREDYRHCFGCGPDNPTGLHLDGFVFAEDGTVRVRFTPRPDHQGFDDVLHGGIVATALDEILAWTAILREGVLVFTAKLELRYRRPARTSVPFTLVGRVDERRGRRLLMSATMSDDEGTVAEAHGLFLVNDVIETAPD